MSNESKRVQVVAMLNYDEGYKEKPQYVTVEYTPNDDVNGCDCTAQDYIDLADGEIVED